MAYLDIHYLSRCLPSSARRIRHPECRALARHEFRKFPETGVGLLDSKMLVDYGSCMDVRLLSL
jgi:hypothetical protein